MAVHIREKPPLRRTVKAVTPSGRRYRWALDETLPENVFGELRHDSTMPGGYGQMDCVLPRDPRVDYADLERLTTLQVLAVGGEIVGEYRLEQAPRTSGDRMSVSPSAVGGQAYLSDDKSASKIYIDRDLAAWGDMSRARRVNWLASSYTIGTIATQADDASGLPSLRTTLQAPFSLAVAEALYDAGAANVVAAIYYDFTAAGVHGDVRFEWFVDTNSQDDLLGSGSSSGNLYAASAAAYFTPANARRYGNISFTWDANLAVAGGLNYDIQWRKLAVYGDHGLTRRGVDPGGFYASDIVAHAVRTWAPLLNFTEGADGTVQPSTFVLPHLAFKERTTAAEIIRHATRVGLQDWAVWANKTFYWHDRGQFARRWRARVGPARLEETGPQVDRLWNSIIVQYRDVDGSTRTVGPPGSGSDTEDSALQDTDPENPANKLGITRRDLLQMGTTTAAVATEVGRRFLEQSKLFDRSGRAELVGWVEDDRGVLHPYTHVRAGDLISFVDSNDTSYRRIVKASHAHPSCTVDLDSPPEGLQALLERLGVSLVPLGLG